MSKNINIKLSIIIVTFNVEEYLINCLKSIIKWWPEHLTEIIIDDSLNKILNFGIKNSKIGIVGGKTLKVGKDEIHRTYFNKINFLTALFEFTNLKKIFPNNIFYRNFYYVDEDENKIKDVFGVSGGFMLIKRDVIDKI